MYGQICIPERSDWPCGEALEPTHPFFPAGSFSLCQALLCPGPVGEAVMALSGPSTYQLELNVHVNHLHCWSCCGLKSGV